MSELKNRTFSDRYRFGQFDFLPINRRAFFSSSSTTPTCPAAATSNTGTVVDERVARRHIAALQDARFDFTFFDRAHSSARRCDTPRKPRCKHGPWGFLRRR